MTFQEFQASGRDVADLSAIEMIANQGIESGQAGRVYVDDLFIETLALDGAPTEYQLTIGSDSRISANLAYLESKLYEFAVLEGYIDAPTFGQIRALYPFTVAHTGGNCTALSLALPNGGHLEITDDAQVPDDNTAVVTVSLYALSGEPITPDGWTDIPTPRLEAWINRALNV